MCVCVTVSTLVHVCEEEDVPCIGVMWYISVRHPEKTLSPLSLLLSAAILLLH